MAGKGATAEAPAKAGTVEVPLNEITGSGVQSGGDEAQQHPPVIVKTITSYGKPNGKAAPTAKVLENKEELEAVASFSRSSGSGGIWVERVEPVKHNGRKVQTGKLISVVLTADDLTKNLQQTLLMLGKRGRLFRIGTGDKSAFLEVAGGSLDQLDYEPEEMVTTIVGTPSGPMMAQVPASQATPATQGMLPMPGMPLMGNFNPYGGNVEAIVEKVVEKLGGAKKSESYELKLLEIQQKNEERAERREREERAEREKEKRERQEREEKLDRERREREEREAKERKEKEEKEERRRQEREEREAKERREKEEKEARERREREEKDRADRLEREKRDAEAREREEKARERQHTLAVEQMKQQMEMLKSIATSSQKGGDDLIEKVIKLRALDAPKDHWKDLERAMNLINGGNAGGGRDWASELVSVLPDGIRALAELKMAPQGGYVPGTIPPSAIQQQPAQVAHNPQQPAAPARPPLDMVELLDAVKSMAEAMQRTPPISPADAVKVFRKPREQGGAPNFCVIAATSSPESLGANLKTLLSSDKVPDEQKALILSFAPLAMSEAGKKWIGEFFVEVRKP